MLKFLSAEVLALSMPKWPFDFAESDSASLRVNSTSGPGAGIGRQAPFRAVYP